jgi:hypothetical protein
VGCGFGPAARLGSKMGRDVHEYVHKSVDLGRSPSQDPSIDQLISVAYAPGTRRHIKAALRHGATIAEIIEVLNLCVVQGVQAFNLLTCRTQGGLQFSFVLVRERGLQNLAACSLQLFEHLVRRGFSYQHEKS